MLRAGDSARVGVPGNARCGLGAAAAGVIVNTHDLLQVVWVAALAGVGLVAAASVGIAGAARATAARREGQALAATLYAAVAVAAALVCAGGVVLGVSVMLSKG